MFRVTRFKSLLFMSLRTASYMSRKRNYYDILGVKPDASLEEIRAAFVKKSNQLHPDRGTGAKDKRHSWQRSSDTELFMEVKEAYDCLRKPEKRAAYNSQFITSAGFLREATHLKFEQETIIDLNKARNDSYMGPRSQKSEASHHFRDLEEEYYREKHKNRTLVVLAGVIAVLIMANICYVWYLRRNRLHNIGKGSLSDKELEE